VGWGSAAIMLDRPRSAVPGFVALTEYDGDLPQGDAMVRAMIPPNPTVGSSHLRLTLVCLRGQSGTCRGPALDLPCTWRLDLGVEVWMAHYGIQVGCSRSPAEAADAISDPCWQRTDLTRPPMRSSASPVVGRQALDDGAVGWLNTQQQLLWGSRTRPRCVAWFSMRLARTR